MVVGQMKISWNGIAGVVCSFLLMMACSSPEEAAQSHLQKGKDFFEKGEFDKALLELKTSNQSSDKNPEVYYFMALLDEKNNNFKSMRQNLIRTLELDPAMLQARLKLGKLDILFGESDKALAEADSILALDAGNTDAQAIKASVYLKQEKRDQAEEIVDSILKSVPDNIDALSIKAQLHYEKNEVDQALALIDKALEKDNKNLPLRLFKIKLNGRDNVDKTEEGYKELIRLYPDVNNFKLSLASIYSMTDKLDAAEALLREVVEKSDDKLEPEIVLIEFFNAKEKNRVVDEYQSMLSRHQGQSKIILELARWMLGAGYVPEAKKGLQQVIDIEKESNTGLTARTILAEIALADKQYDEAENSINEILNANSEFIQANLLKARLFLVKNKTDESIELLNRLVWGKTNIDDVYSLLGQAYLIKQDRKQADKSFKQALEANPANLTAFDYIYGGYIAAGQKETARQLLERALAKMPNQALFLTSKAELDISEKKWDDAQQVVQRLALFSKEKAVPVYLQANILKGRGKYPEAIALYEKILQQFPNHLKSMISLVESYEALKHREAAVSFLENHHFKYPDDLNSVGVLSDLYMADKDVVKTNKLLADQLKRTPKAISLYIAKARIETIMNKDVGAAKNVFLRALEVNKDDPQLLTALAGLYEQTNEGEKARKVYEQLLAKNPEANLAANNLASLLIESGDIEQGMKLAARFKESENPYFQDTYAWGLIKTGSTAEGLKILESLVLKEPKLPEFRYHLGVAHFNTGNRATAITELKQAISLSDKQKRQFSGKDNAEKILKELGASSGK